MPLQDKIRFTERRIHEWVEHFGVNGCYVSFSGSGTTCLVAYKTKRRFIGIEKDEKYHKDSIDRLWQEQRQMKLF